MYSAIGVLLLQRLTMVMVVDHHHQMHHSPGQLLMFSHSKVMLV
jgi:hypothetical protein